MNHFASLVVESNSNEAPEKAGFSHLSNSSSVSPSAIPEDDSIASIRSSSSFVKNIGEKRRKEALERQKQTRRDSLALLRSMVKTAESEVLETPAESKNEPQRSVDQEQSQKPKKYKKKKQEFYARQLMEPEPLNDIPSDLGSSWIIMPLPPLCDEAVDKTKGFIRCVVVASSNGGIARRQNGSIIARFPCILPVGTVIDGLLDLNQKLCYVLDMLSWKYMPLIDCNTETRLFYRDSRLQETEECSVSSNYNAIAFKIIPYFACDLAGIAQAYSSLLSKEMDYCMIYHRETNYVIGETNPLMNFVKGSDVAKIGREIENAT